MAFHADFWLAAGAAAPVIALANQVTLGGLLGWTWRPYRRDPSAGLLLPFPLGKGWLSLTFSIGTLNLLSQTAAFGFALFSVLFGRNVFSAPAVGAAEVVGLALVPATSVLARYDRVLRRIREQVESEAARPGPQPGAGASGSHG